jgi:hypothetical protein
MRCFIMSENPMMALSGVRSSWLTAARNSDLDRLAAMAASRSAIQLSEVVLAAGRMDALWALGGVPG